MKYGIVHSIYYTYIPRAYDEAPDSHQLVFKPMYTTHSYQFLRVRPYTGIILLNAREEMVARQHLHHNVPNYGNITSRVVVRGP